ncbi:hypothetical protein [Actinophytocola xanthii]|uniref:Uncharacterized protein n=1 Tax=Actinophytocola xanthii TaxID=1912961 RepID=A0A1Q8CTG0_9PSEU|nr:hypothetical protein [Actinophytocola xanthii]OLF17642.1 hypothetical protein BU204_10520 [Actinophytocola xanthii]
MRERTHQELLALAGRVPDDWLVIAREVLAAGDTARLSGLRAALAAARPADTVPEPAHMFVPGQAHDHEREDRAVVEAIRSETGAEACWATMRGGSERVYLVQAGAGADLPAITVAAHRALSDTPRVEVFARDEPLPGYHQLALRAATLLWSSAPEPTITVARVFDGAGAGGPWFAPDHELVVDPAERARLLDFLGGGELVLAADSLGTDIVTGAAAAVPASLRSDGRWVWSDAAGYYLDRHQLAPDPGLAEHAMGTWPTGPLSPLTRHHVWTALSASDREAPQWSAG